MKKIITFVLLLVCSLSVTGRPAYPGIRSVRQPDGSTIQIVVHGDEWGHWITDVQGRVMVRKEDGFIRVAEGVTPQMAAQAASVSRRARVQMRNEAAAVQSSSMASGQKRFLVILVEFPDCAFSTSNINATVTSMLNSEGYSDAGATGSARDYFKQNSHDFFDPVFDVYGPYVLPHDMAYYGGNDNSGSDQKPEQAVVDGCNGMNSQIDYSKYDLDGDGKVDMVFMFSIPQNEDPHGSSGSARRTGSCVQR